MNFLGVPGSSAGKQYTCNAGDPDLIPGSGRSTGEGMGYPPQYSWVSLVAQLVKNLPAMRKTWVRSLGWEDPLKKGTAIPSSTLAWRSPWGCKESDMTEGLSLSTFRIKVMLYIPSCYYNARSMPGTWANVISYPVACFNLMRKTCLHRNNGNTAQQNSDEAEWKLTWGLR